MSVTTETSYLYGWEHPDKMRGSVKNINRWQKRIKQRH